MSVSFENKETNRGVLTFTISQDQIKPELDRVFNSVKKSLNVPGFRKGHLPRPIFDQKFGEESLYQDVMNALLPNAYEAAVKEAGLEVVAQPKIDVTSMEKGQDWVITAEVVTKPEVKLGDYKNLEVSVDVEKEVTDADVEERIERERNNLAELVIKEAAAENGDTVVIDFVGSIDGVEFDGGKGENFSLGLGSGQFIPGFEDQLVGHSAGETVDVIVTFPEDYQAEDLAGKEAKFVTTIHEVKAKEVPALDDELAKDIDEEVETLAELKEKYRKELAAAKEEAYKDAVEGAAIDKAVENAEIVELPEEMIHEEVHRSVNEFLETCNVKVLTLTCTSKSLELLKKTFTNNTKQKLSHVLRLTLLSKQLRKLKDLTLLTKKSKKKSSNWLQTTTWKLHKYKACFHLKC